MKFSKLVLLFSIIILFNSCKTKVPQTTVETIKFEDNDKEDNSIDEEKDKPEVEITDTATTLPIDTIVENINESKKAIYNVAVILPFMEDTVRKSWSKAKDKNFSEMLTTDEAEKAISFFEGMQLALNDVKFDSKFKIKVYDSNNSKLTTAEIIYKLKKDSIDIIIGPYSKQNVQTVSKYALENNIIHISPFSPSKSASLGNEKYYMVEPSLEQHILSMVQYGIDSVEKPFIKFVYHDTESGKEYASLVQSYIDAENETRSVEEQIRYDLLIADKIIVKDNIDEEDNNVIIVNSFSEDFLHVFLRQTTAFGETSSILFGMPGWEKSEIVRLSHLNDAKVHFTTASWIDEKNKNIATFNKMYQTKYKAIPKESTYLGYDIVAVFLKMIDENGIDFNKALLGFEFKGISRNFIFKQVLSSDNKVHRIENTDLHIYKIEDFEKILVK